MATRPDLRTAAFSTLQRLVYLEEHSPSELAKSKADLARACGLSSAQLYVHLSLLGREGLARLISSDVRMVPSRVEVTGEGREAAAVGPSWEGALSAESADTSVPHPADMAGVVSGAESHENPLVPPCNPPYIPESHYPVTNPVTRTVPPASQSGRGAAAGPAAQGTAKVIPLRRPTPKNVPAAALRRAAPVTAPADTVEEVEPAPKAPKPETAKVGKREVTVATIPGFDTQMTTQQVWHAAFRGELGAEAMAHLLKLKTSSMKPWHKAAVAGLVMRIKRQYVAKWSQSTGAPQSKYVEPPKAEGYWKQIAENIIKLGVTVERFMEVAWNAKRRDLKAPTLPLLAGPALFSTIQAGGDGIADQTGLEKGADGMTFDELLERSIESGAWPRNLDAYRAGAKA